jgi:hypothetical protein
VGRKYEITMMGTEIISALGMMRRGRSISPAITDIESKPEYIHRPMASPPSSPPKSVSPAGRNGCHGTPCQWAKPSTVITTNGTMMITVKTIELRATTLRPRMLM